MATALPPVPEAAGSSGARKRKRAFIDLGVQFQCPCCFRPGTRFCDRYSPEDAVKRLLGLRTLMAAHGADAYIVGSGDAHASEYVASADERRAWLTGFTGSAGTAVVTATQALLWTDSRYFLQAEEQLKGTEWILMRTLQPGVLDTPDWISKHLEGKSVGVDPALTPAQRAQDWRKKWAGKVKMLEIAENLVDPIWLDRPEDPSGAIDVHPLEYAGESVDQKLKRVREETAARGAKVLVLSALDQIAWLFNLRGSDVECNPVFFAYSIVSEESAWLFARALDEGKGGLSLAVQEHLKASGVVARPYSAFFSEARGIIAGRSAFVEPATCSLAILSLVPEENRVEGTSPVEEFKAVKNEAEAEGLRRASRRDSAAICEFLATLGSRLVAGDSITEVAAAELMASLRKKEDLCIGDSFPTISSAGSNCALPHYQPEAATCKTVQRGQIYLCDTGGQYKDGTTDITRTVHFGEPSEEERRVYTRVLQGHIMLAAAVFPEETPGLMLDMLARQPLWQAGMDYGHGTGHGIGAYMNVHEGPIAIGGGSVPASVIRKSERMKTVYLEPFRAGHFVSDEPGCYVAGKFGVRIESDLLVVPAETECKMGSRPWLKFEYLTMVPMCRALLEPSLLSPAEVRWLDAYHHKVWDTLQGSLSAPAREWLQRETRPLGQ